MKIAVVVFAVWAGVADAGTCPQKITAITLDDDSVHSVEGRTGDVVEVRLETGDYGVGYAYQAGLIPLRVDGIDGVLEYDWATPLPALSDLVPGAGFRLEGSLRAEGTDEAFAMDLLVLGPDSMTVGGCTLDVVKVETQEWFEGNLTGSYTLLLHLPSLLVLRSELKTDEGLVVTEAVALR